MWGRRITQANNMGKPVATIRAFARCPRAPDYLGGEITGIQFSGRFDILSLP
jgi:hypothetical protein